MVFERIVVPIDLESERDTARWFAAGLARRAATGLEFVSVASPKLDHDDDKKALAEVGGTIPGVPVQTQVVESNDVAAAVVEEAGTTGLICMETHARASIKALFVGSVASHVLRDTSQPVLLVGPKCDPHPAFSVVEMCIDAEDTVPTMTPVVGELARTLGLSVRVAHVMDPDQPFHDTDEEIRDQLHAIVEELGTDFGVEAEYVILHGPEVPALIAEDAEHHGASIIAVALRRRSALRRAVLGSVAMALAHGTTAGVIAIPCCPVHA